MQHIHTVKKKYEQIWLALPYVQAVGIGILSDGSKGIIISVTNENQIEKSQLPKEVEGVKIELKTTGPINAL